MVRLSECHHAKRCWPILGALGALGLTIAFVALRRSKPRDGDQDGDKRRALADSSGDHLGGADTAIQMVQGLSDADRGGPEGVPFESLYQQFREDRSVVEGTLAELWYTSRSAKRLAGRATGRAFRLVAGGAPGDLSLFRTLKALAIGVQGKRCLWRPHGRFPRFHTRLVCGALSNWQRLQSSVGNHRATSPLQVRRTFSV